MKSVRLIYKLKYYILFCSFINSIELLGSYPQWGDPVSVNEPPFTAIFRIPTDLVRRGKARFNLVVNTNEAVTLNSYKITIYEDDLLNKKIYENEFFIYTGNRFSPGSSIIEVTSFTTEGINDLLASTEKLYAEIEIKTGDFINYELPKTTKMKTPSASAILHKDDEYENNDSYTNAYLLSKSNYNQLIMSDDVDWFKFNVPSIGSNYLIRINNFFNIAGNFNIFLYDSYQTQLAFHASQNDEEEISYIFSKTGTYYIKIVSADQGKGFYDLKCCALPLKPTPIIGPTNLCQNSSGISYYVTNTTGVTYNWHYSGSGAYIAAGQGTYKIAVNYSSTATSGYWTVTPSNSCGSGLERTLAVTINPAPSRPSTISGPISVCQNSTGNSYSVTNVSGITYNWSFSGSGASITSGQGTYRITVSYSATATSGTWSVIPNNNCGPGPERTLAVTINPAPSQPSNISGPTAVCQGSSQTYSIATVAGATSYTWSLPSGWSGSSTSSSITATAGASGGTISVTANNSCGVSTARTLSVSVTALPAQPGPITGQTSVTQGNAYTYSISPVSGATSYSWSLPSGWSGSSSSTSISATAGASGGTISVTANNSCGSGTPQTLNVNTCSPPAQPGAISGPTAVCQGSSQTYSIATVAGATSYTWSLPSGWSGSSTSSSITATAGASGGIISVTTNSSCGVSTARTLSVSVTALPAQPGPITGQTSVTQGNAYTYSISPVSGATSYSWSLPSGWSGSSSSTSISATAGASGGTISVTANNSCGISNPSRITVTNSAGFLHVYNIDGSILNNNDLININNSYGGTISLRIESTSNWTVTENSLWFTALKENNTTLKVNYLENVSKKDKISPLTIENESNNQIRIYIQQKAKASSLRTNKFDNVVMYPNPASNTVNITFGEEEFETIVINITDINGHLMKTQEFRNVLPNQIIELDVEKFSSGHYMIHIGDGIIRRSMQLIVF